MSKHKRPLSPPQEASGLCPEPWVQGGYLWLSQEQHRVPLNIDLAKAASIDLALVQRTSEPLLGSRRGCVHSIVSRVIPQLGKSLIERDSSLPC